MRITFVMPVEVKKPVGGFKIVYEYANRLSQRGHTVTVVHRRNSSGAVGWKRRLLETVILWFERWDRRGISRWFALRPDVCMAVVPEIVDKAVPDGDVVIATAWQTAFWVNALNPRKGRKYYFIQHDETCMGPVDQVNETWTLPLRKIVIARWLLEKARAMGQTAARVPNGMDLETLHCEQPVESRTPRIGMLYHNTFLWKGTEDGLDAIQQARLAHPVLEAVLFGTNARPADLLGWIEYQQLPTPEELRALYNRCSIFLQASWTEGWGLTATEAMACGCALVTTDNGGSQDYAIDEVTALVAPPKEPARLAHQVGRLLNDDALRQSLAHAGMNHVQQYTWAASAERFEQALSEEQNWNA